MKKSCLLWLSVLADLFRFLVLSLRSESSLAAENLFLRKQLGFYRERKIKPRRTSPSAQVTLILLSRWFNWRRALTVVTPRTFIGWQRKRSQRFWRKKCQAGRPRIPPDLQRLIRKMARESVLGAWTLQQLREAIPSDHTYRYILHDHNAIFSS